MPYELWTFHAKIISSGPGKALSALTGGWAAAGIARQTFDGGTGRISTLREAVPQLKGTSLLSSVSGWRVAESKLSSKNQERTGDGDYHHFERFVLPRPGSSGKTGGKAWL
ncbi:hypothetical protein SBDP2_680009 [Syntrophobacter sp. SbD2]|nr:hypothetical protein SBDP2_680009 [Syntrophobacter sp. SbD2]